MKILNVGIENFLGMGSANVQMNRPGITLVEGVNNDSDAALSNGAGKSTLFEAVLWCLYGVTRRGLRGDDVVNRHAGSGCRVDVVFEANGTTYNVARTRKSSSTPTAHLTLHEYGGTDLTKGTVKDTQTELDGILGMSATVFQRAVFFGQGDVKPFAALSDAELKAVFEQALGLTWYSENRAKMAGYLAGLKQTIERGTTEARLLESELELKRHKVEACRESIRQAEEAERVWSKQRTDEISTLTEDNQRRREESSDAAKKAAVLAAQIDEKASALEKLNELNVQLGNAISAKSRDAAVAGSLLSSTSKAAESIDKRIHSIQGMGGTTCETCLQPVDADGIARVALSLASERDELNKRIVETRREFDEARAKMGNLQTMDKQLQDKVKKVSDEITEGRSEHRALVTKQTIIDSDVAKIEARINELKDELSEGAGHQRDEVVKLHSTLDILEADVDVAMSRINDANDAIADATAKQADASLLVSALGNGGVKSYVFDTVTPELNEWANKYLQVLEPDMSVEIATVTKLKSGEYREKFSVAVNCTSGGNSISALSGGEQQKVNLSVALAFNRLMRSMMTGDAPLLVLDEPFEALDSGSSDQVLELLKVLDADSLYLITHNEAVRDLVPARIIVEKSGGKATVSVHE